MFTRFEIDSSPPNTPAEKMKLIINTVAIVKAISRIIHITLSINTFWGSSEYKLWLSPL
jgi:hypothetical protein